jgi:flagellar biosynthetic protein FliQ
VNELVIARLAQDALKTSLLVAGPALLVSLIVGLMVSVFQVVTSLQDQTIAFVPKMVVVMLVVVATFPWMLRVMSAFTIRMFTDWSPVLRGLG